MLKNATVAIEDERFYKHKGVDYEGIVRAAVKNFINKKTVEGGSTLTMQLVKNLYTADRSRSRPGRLPAQDPRGQARRGARERARQGVDPREVPEHDVLRHGRRPDRDRRRGGGAGLLQQARASDLNLREAALLAGLPQAPTRLLADPPRPGRQAPPQPGARQDGRARDDHRSAGRRAREAQGPRASTRPTTSAAAARATSSTTSRTS